MQNTHPSQSSAIHRLADEIKLCIISHLDKSTAIYLACVNRGWQDMVESVLWRHIQLKPRYVNSLSASGGHDRRWLTIMQALEKRPARQQYVKAIEAYFCVNNTPHLASILKLCSKSLEEIHHGRLQTVQDSTRPPATSEYGSLVTAVRQCGQHFPRVRSLTLLLEEEEVQDVVFTPFSRLVDLRLEFPPDGSDSLIVRNIASSNTIRSLTINSDSCWATVVSILKSAKNLQIVNLPRSMEVIAPLWRPLKEFTHSATTSSLLIESAAASTALLNLWAKWPAGFLPKLKHLAVNCQLGRAALPPHNALEQIHLRGFDFDDYPVTGDYLGTTVLFAPSYFDTTAWTEHDSWPDHGGLEIRSLANGTDTLFYVSADLELNQVLFHSHHVAYTASAEIFVDIDETRKRNRVMGNIDLSYYRGYPLPYALLDHIPGLYDGDFGGVTPRGLSLPEEVWEILDGWYKEAKKELQGKSPQEILGLMNYADFDHHIRRDLLPIP